MKKTHFRRSNIPSISINEYVIRICNYVVVLEPSTLLTVLSYAHTLCQLEDEDQITIDSNPECSKDTTHKSPLLLLDMHSVHRFIISGIVLASKALGDHFYSNTFYAKVGGISIKELNCLELELAFLLDWRLQCPLPLMASIWRRLDIL